MNSSVFILLIMLAGCATRPNAPLPARPIATQSATAQSVERIIAPPKTMTLTWDYPPHGSEIVFNVYGTESLPPHWQPEATVSDPPWTFIANRPQRFYTVTASNVLTGKESIQ